MIGQCKCGHTKLFCSFDEVRDLGEAVEEGVVGVCVEVDE
jgi:hypothetical protein